MILTTLDHPPARRAPLLDSIDALTAQAWVDAGVCEGMRVLVAGRGIGALASLAAALVEPRGSVVRADASSATMRAAAQRDGVSSWSHARAAGQPLDPPALDAPVDAVLVRSGLLQHDDPWATLRQLVRCAKPGGLVVVQELDDEEQTEPIVPTIFDRLMLETTGSPTELRIALRLSRIFRAAGLLPPQFRLSGDVVSRRAREADGARPTFVSAAVRRMAEPSRSSPAHASRGA